MEYYEAKTMLFDLRCGSEFSHPDFLVVYNIFDSSTKFLVFVAHSY